MLLRTILFSVAILTPLLAAGQTGNDNANPEIQASETPENPVLAKLEEIQNQLNQLTNVPARVEKNEQDIKDLSGNLSNALAAIQELKETVNDLNTNVRNQVARQHQILEAISTTDSQDRRVLNLAAIMETSSEFKEDVSKAVHDSLKPVGKFTIVNKTNSYRQIYVNQRPHGIDPGKSLTLTEEVGTVTTQLPGQRLENWTLSAPSYAEKIEIIPIQQQVQTSFRPSTSVYNPTSTVYRLPTTVYDPPLVYDPSRVTYYYYPTQPWYYYSTYSPWYSAFP